MLHKAGFFPEPHSGATIVRLMLSKVLSLYGLSQQGNFFLQQSPAHSPSLIFRVLHFGFESALHHPVGLADRSTRPAGGGRVANGRLAAAGRGGAGDDRAGVATFA